MEPRPEDDDELRSLEEVERAIRRELDRLEVDLAPLFELGRLEDPASSFGRFESTAERLEERLVDLGQSLDGLASRAPLDLSRVASRLLQDMLLELEKPLVLRVRWAASLPQPVVAPDPLRSMLIRLFELVGRFASPGDALEIGTECVDDDVALLVVVVPAHPRTLATTFELIRQRSDTLQAFVQDLGGRFELASDAGSVRLRVRLPLGTPKR